MWPLDGISKVNAGNLVFNGHDVNNSQSTSGCTLFKKTSGVTHPDNNLPQMLVSQNGTDIYLASQILCK